MSKKRNFGLDFLRALAIILVLVAHLLNIKFPGVLGVEIFFVLSGFLIGRILYKLISNSENFNKDELLSFWKRRWFRTLPNFFFYFFLYFILMKYNIFENKYTFQSSDYLGLIFLQNFFSPNSAFFNVSWSLAVEEWFYILLAAFTFIFSKILYPTFKSRETFFLIVAFMLLTPLFLRTFDILEIANYRKVVLGRLDALMYGVILSIIYVDHKHLWKKIKKYTWIWLCASILVFIFLKYENPVFFSVVPLFLSLLIPFFYSFSLSTNWIRRVITSIAILSYSLYLSHILIYGILYYIFSDYKDLILAKIGIKGLTLIIAFIVSGLTYKYIELYFVRFRDSMSLKPLGVAKKRFQNTLRLSRLKR